MAWRALGILLMLAGCAVDGEPQVDGDEDGHAASADCDDANPDVFPGAPESCDEIDSDCDGDLADGFDDLDGDALPDCIDEDVDGDGSDRDADCDDLDPARFPGAEEACDDVDSDCDGSVVDGFPDLDGDGTPDCTDADADGDGVSGAEDCDDLNPDVHPWAMEFCDEVDTDCDGDLAESFPDADDDGLPDCIDDDLDGDGYPNEEDCEAEEADVHPGATEVCDGFDTDCDGEQADDDVDADGDAIPACAGDCDDLNHDVHPWAMEACDGVDTDCDGALAPDEVDDDGDGSLLCGGDCDDDDATLYPGAPELCDRLDNDCSGGRPSWDFDLDGDGLSECEGDCGPYNPQVLPGAVEFCDGVDNDCDGLVDAADSEFQGADFDGDGDPAPACGGGDCDDFDPTVDRLDHDGDGPSSCYGDCDDRDPYVGPGQGEACDGVDTDCDGLVDAADPDFDPDWDGDGVETAGCSVGGADCDDRDPHVFPEPLYTSGVEPACAPLVYPGFPHEFHFARVSLPSYFQDPVSGDHFLYFRGHEAQAEQAIGYVDSADGIAWGAPVGPILEPDPASWDARNLSNPSVAYVPGLLRPYLMAYHARDGAGTLRQIGLATATAPGGPFARLDPNDGSPLLDPVLPPAAVGPDSARTLHPALHFDGVDLHLWYSGRTEPHDTLRVLHATSTDGGVTWLRTDDDGDGEADVLYDRDDVSWSSGHVTQVSALADPFGEGAFEFWFTVDSGTVGHAAALDAVTWGDAGSGPALEPSADCSRVDGALVSGRGIRYDPAEDAYHWAYGGQTDLAACPANDPLEDVYANGANTVSYVASGVNLAPRVTLDAPSADPSQTLSGSVEDSAPDQLIVTLASDLDGFLGTAVVAPTGNSDPGPQSTTWTLAVAALGSGPHVITATAVDEAMTVREASAAVEIVP